MTHVSVSCVPGYATTDYFHRAYRRKIAWKYADVNGGTPQTHNVDTVEK